MKVIFLDFNGVLDTYDDIDKINSVNLLRLKEIVDETGASVVISSSIKNSYYYTSKYGKMLSEVVNVLTDNDINVLGITPLKGNREDEIKEYLDNHPEIDNFCIIDDDFDMKSFKGNMVKLPTQSKKNPYGLTKRYMDAAIKILKR